MKKYKYGIYKSGSWTKASIDDLDNNINHTTEMMDKNEEVINIQLVQDDGINRFWIYTRELIK